MKTNVGLWIDHRKAVIVTITDTGEKITQVLSEVEKQLSRTGDTPLGGSYDIQHVPADDSQQKALTGHLNVYYDEVIANIRTADSIMIMGPGEPKGELKKRLEKNKLGERIACVESAERMTEPQLAAKVRKYFSK